MIFVMAGTGVVLACENAVMALAERRYFVTVPEGAGPASPAELAESVKGAVAVAEAPFLATSIRYKSDPRAPVLIRAGRTVHFYANPYTGEVLGNGFPRIEGFFEGVRAWHRWVNLPVSWVRRGRAVTGAANVAFFFLLLTGPLLWIPHRITGKTLSAVLFFRRGVQGKQRDLNWHQVIGIWSVAPLLVIVASGVLLSYPGVGDRVYPVVGNGMAFKSLPGGVVSVPVLSEGETWARGMDAMGSAQDGERDLGAALVRAASWVPDWRHLELTLPREGDGRVRVEVRAGGRGQPQKAGVLMVERETGVPVSWEPFDAASPGRRAQQFLRFAHTGEYWGAGGQVLAGLFSLAAVLMTWTGLSLALRRLAGVLARVRAGAS